MDETASPEREPTRRTQVTIPPELRVQITELQVLANLSTDGGAIATMLSTFTGLLRAEALRIPFTLNEAKALTDILNTGSLTLQIGNHIAFGEVLDAFDLARKASQHTYAERYNLNEDALLAKLRGIGPACDLALRLTFARHDPLDEDFPDLRILAG